MAAIADSKHQQRRRRRHPRPIDPQQEYVRAYQLPALYPFSRAYFTKLLASGAIASFRINNARVVSRKVVDAWIAAQNNGEARP